MGVGNRNDDISLLGSFVKGSIVQIRKAGHFDSTYL